MTIESNLEKMTASAIKSKTRGAMKWYIGRINSVRGGAAVTADPKFAAPVRSNHKPFVGGMFQFVYRAKHHDTLPYWDAFPLMIPIEFYPDGFLGINLHYLPIKMRAKMLDKLMSFETTIKTGTNGTRTYMKLSYAMLSKMKDIPAFQHCLKRYLFTQVKSKVIRIDSSYWDTVAFLPTQQFQKQSERVVWNDAKNSVKSKKRRGK